MLRALVDPALIWVLFVLVLSWIVWRRGFRFARILFALFVVYSLVLSSPYALYLASRPLENFALEKFKYSDASL